MKIKIIILIGLLSLCYLLNSTTWHIKQDGTGDFTSIQEGINASVDNDIILVYPGTYYENINFNGKSLTIGSLEMTTGDEQYISHTIIDGQNLFSVVRLRNEEVGCILRGFTITNGKGSEGDYHEFAGGISIHGDQDALIQLDVINCVIKNNTAINSGGIQCHDADLYLSGTIIKDNYAAYIGGGIVFSGYSQVAFDQVNRCSIFDNLAAAGADLYISDSYLPSIDVYLDTFTVNPPTRFFAGCYFEEIQLTFDIMNHTLDLVDQDLYVSPDGDDANTGLTSSDPMKTILLAIRKIKSNENNPKTVFLTEGTYSKQLNNQLFPIGTKSFVDIVGFNVETTIFDGNDAFCMFMFLGCHIERFNIENITFTNSRHDNGIIFYTKVYDVNFRNLTLRDNWIYDNGTMIDGGQSHNIEFDNVTFENNVSNEYNAGLYIAGSENITINNCSFVNNQVISSMVNSSALNLLFYGYAIINNSKFINNYAENVSTISSGACTVSVYRHNTWDGDIYITNSLFCDNFASANTADQVLVTRSEVGSSTLISNCTFTNNQNSSIGNSATFVPMGNISISNSIFNNSSTNEIILGDRTQWGYIDTLSIQYCNIDGGQNAIVNQNNANIVNWLEGNIDEDPLFLLSGNDPYQLTNLSPCIDTGTPDTTGIFIPPWDLLHHERIWDGDENGSEIIDMGCYEFDAEPYVEAIQNLKANSPYKLSNYPNPFNPETTISFNILEQGKVELAIYNIKGQRIKTLLNNRLDQGRHEVTWNGEDDRNAQVGSGVYFYNLKTKNQTIVKKMILLK
ncbi:T9SS type A sorting domain-containing protein [Candidatus Cloacimonadota bacterium]